MTASTPASAPPPRTPGLVTAMVICYNHARFVEEALESVRGQRHPALQLLVIDDASTDGTLDVVERWARATGFPCEIRAHPRNLGLVRTINEAYALARGEFLAGVPGDDRWAPGRIAAHVDAFASLPPDYAMVYSDARIIDEEGRTVEGSFIARHRNGPPPEGDIFKPLLEGNFIPGCSAMVRLACFDRVGPFDEALAFEDYDMWLRLAARFRFAFVPGALSDYRLVRTSLSLGLEGDPARRRQTALTNFLLVEKAAGLRQLRADERALVNDRLDRLAQRVYMTGCPESRAILRRTAMRTRSARARLLLLAAALGIRYGTLARLKGALA